MNYNWSIHIEQQMSQSAGERAVTFEGGADKERPPTSMDMVVRPGSSASSVISSVEYNPLTIDPICGSILPGGKTNFTLKFSPLDVQEYVANIVCG